eukprot:3813778-Amphidinium_carterae.2
MNHNFHKRVDCVHQQLLLQRPNELHKFHNIKNNYWAKTTTRCDPHDEEKNRRVQRRHNEELQEKGKPVYKTQHRHITAFQVIGDDVQ